MERESQAEVVIRQLGQADAAAYQALRLEGLRTAPSAFGSSEREEAHLTREQVEARLTAALPEVATLGAFLGQQLVGTVTVIASTRYKTAHKAMIAAMYVTGAARQQGIGRKLMEAAIAYAQTLPLVEELEIAVTVGNEAARHLYLSLGFAPYAVEPRHIKLDGRYYDMEWMVLRLKKGG